MTIFKTAILSFALTACTPAYQHWLTDEEDANLKAKCEHAECVMVRGAFWLEIKEFIYSLSGPRI